VVDPKLLGDAITEFFGNQEDLESLQLEVDMTQSKSLDINIFYCLPDYFRLYIEYFKQLSVKISGLLLAV
jgi:hypothetical protein